MSGRPEEAGEQPAPAPEPGEETVRGAVAAAEEHGPTEPPAAEAQAAAEHDAAMSTDAPAGSTGPADDAPRPVTSSDTVADEAAAPVPETADEPDPALLAEGVRIAEALIFASDRPVTPAILANVLPESLSPTVVAAALATACEGRGVVLTEVAGGWAFRTAPDLAQRLTKVVQAPRRLPRAAMEALSVIAYHQPCTRGEIEEIRGASLAQTTLEALLELGLIAPRGRREVPGRPTLWGTTPKFLEQFGLKALSDLPRKEELVTAETGPALPLPGVAARPGLRAATGGAPSGEPDETATEDPAGAPEPAADAAESEPPSPVADSSPGSVP